MFMYILCYYCKKSLKIMLMFFYFTVSLIFQEWASNMLQPRAPNNLDPPLTGRVENVENSTLAVYNLGRFSRFFENK